MYDLSISPEIYILLPVHNRKKITLDFVADLKRQTLTNYQLILIDDGSTDGTSEAVLGELPNTHVIYGDGNLWWAGALQAAIDYLKSKKIEQNTVVLMINDDTRFDSDFLEKGIGNLRHSPKSIVCARAYSLQTDKLREVGVKIDWLRFRFLPTENEAEFSCLTTRGLFLRFADILEIGGFKPSLLPHYYSDYEFTLRAKNRGFALKSPENLKLKMNEETTGLQSPDQMSLRGYFKKAFSIRSAINPWTAVKFVHIAAPTKYKIPCFSKLIVYFATCVIKSLRNGI